MSKMMTKIWESPKKRKMNRSLGLRRKTRSLKANRMKTKRKKGKRWRSEVITKKKRKKMKKKKRSR
jgi:hypothetical protein